MKKITLLGTLLLSLSLAACSTKSDSSSNNSNTQKNTTESTKVASSSTKESSDFVATANDSSFDGTTLKGNSYSIKITAHKILQPGEKGNEYGKMPVIAFWFDTLVNPKYDNSVPISPNNAWIMNFKAVQDNDPNKVNELKITSLPDEKYINDQSAEIKPGGKISSAVAYELSDTETPVTLKAQNIMGDQFGSAEFPVK
ncbi:DUF5067 domain-containing protein [Enterococcus hirae]|uniref:DUF5067 domain-containing protein n=1 Tax=Enterococcus hirae TaxID=1354 RepID=UPI002DD62A96|nr:DUF5067 domain-containing protein [Enterococcus hirae]MEC4730837.1 DUF5067 domain-containing protein [Enterococcus hirae]